MTRAGTWINFEKYYAKCQILWDSTYMNYPEEANPETENRLVGAKEREERGPGGGGQGE